MINLLRKTWAFMRRDLKTALSYPLAFVLSLGGIFFSVVMWFFFSRMISGADISSLEKYGNDYFSFVIVGLALQNYLSVAMGGLTKSIRESQVLGTLEMLLSSPTSLHVIIFSSSVGPFLLTTLRMAVFFLFSIMMGKTFNCNSPEVVLLVVLLSITSFSVFGIISAAVILVLKRGNPFNLLIGASSSLLAGIFYPVEVLHPWLQTLAWFLPVTHSVEAMRVLMLTGGGFMDVSGQVVWLAIFSMIAMPFSLWVFGIGVRRATKDGSLAHY